MGKNSSKKKRKKASTSPGRSTRRLENQAPSFRNHSLDALRGLAIVLMIIDHAALFLWEAKIEPGSVRLVTRLSMPLFCVLAGYFVGRKLTAAPNSLTDYWRDAIPWSRLGQVAVAAIVLDFVYFSIYRQFEILASLLLCYLAMYGLGRFFVVAVAAFLLFPTETSYILSPTEGGASLFDFPVCVVASCCVCGFLAGRWQPWVGFLAAGLIPIAAMQQIGDGPIVTVPSIYVLICLFPAMILLWLGLRWPQLRMPLLGWIGRYPLTIYVSQYLILLLFAEGA